MSTYKIRMFLSKYGGGYGPPGFTEACKNTVRSWPASGNGLFQKRMQDLFSKRASMTIEAMRAIGFQRLLGDSVCRSAHNIS